MNRFTRKGSVPKGSVSKGSVPVWVVGLLIGLVVVAGSAMSFGGGGGDDDDSGGNDGGSTDGSFAAEPSWNHTVADANGQTVTLWMWGGEAALNQYIDNEVVETAKLVGVELKRVPIDDTAAAIARIAEESEAGIKDGAIDLLWVNGKNFVQASEAGLWHENWVGQLPNAELLDPLDPTLWNDFGVPTMGQEMPWSRAAFVFAADGATLGDPPDSFEAFLEYARSNPGRLTYPAPPDFTGSAFVRQAVQALGEDAAMEYLAELAPHLWRGGKNYPVDQAELEQLFASGQIDVAMSYNPNFVDIAVGRGAFPETVRPYVFSNGTLQNVSFLAIPATSGSLAGAKVVANLMLSTELQRLKLDLVGIPPVLDIGSEQSGSPQRLVDFGVPLEELQAARVPAIDRRWIEEVLR